MKTCIAKDNNGWNNLSLVNLIVALLLFRNSVIVCIQYTEKFMNNVSFRNYVRTKAVYQSGISKKTQLQHKKLSHGKLSCQTNNWWGMNLSIGITWTNLCIWFLFLFYANCKNDKNNLLENFICWSKVPNFLRDKEGNIWREGSFGKKSSRQKSQANSWRHYTQFIQGALFQTTLFTSKPKYGKMLE